MFIFLVLLLTKSLYNRGIVVPNDMGEYRKVAHPANMHDGDILWFNHIYESDRKKTHTACLFIFLGIGEIKVFHGGNQFCFRENSQIFPSPLCPLSNLGIPDPVSLYNLSNEFESTYDIYYQTIIGCCRVMHRKFDQKFIWYFHEEFGLDMAIN